MRIFVSHAQAFDFKNKLYNPLIYSTLNNEHQIFFPHESKAETNTYNEIVNSDLVIAEVSEPSIGVGIELGWAHSLKVPIICLYSRRVKPSKSLKYLTKMFVEYRNIEDMMSKLMHIVETL